ncbi:MAG: High-affinity nickel-transporter [Actinomycetota bacterium]|nr:High-affinity nickel-transporter [Actinomycetota bacterium]
MTLVVVGCAGVAGAHPLGNFTVNRYARVEVSAGVVRVHYVLDEAEIPAFQDRAQLAAGRAGFAARRAGEIAGGLRLLIDGEPVDLVPSQRLVSEPPGQGGLKTLRLAVTYAAALPPGPGPDEIRRGSFRDENQPDRIGWREVLVVARGDAEILSSDVPARDASDELRRYPADLLQAPLDRRSADFSFVPGRVAVPPSPLTEAAAAPPRAGGGFAALVGRGDGGGVALAGALVLAVGFGAVHALAPGHGKTVMAAYLVGTRGRPRDAVALGTIVSLMHTASVLALALVLARLDRSVAAEDVYPWLTLVSGVVVTGVGVVLLARRWRSRAPGGAGGAEVAHDHGHHDHDDGHDHHGHGHDHDDGHDHHDHHGHDHGHHLDHDHDPDHDLDRGHSHSHGHGHGHGHALPPDVSPLSRRGLIALGASGGLFPSPSAVVVVISAFSLDRAGLGLALVAAFSVGLAVTLTAVGLALVYGRAFAERRGSRMAIEVLPLLGAAALVLVGIVVTGQGVRGV